ncbi:EamA family transporter [Celerinatantimonas sp. YJH-8]|uniref:EamA family transporter n=1 Tax=Celerinatantimonas sp. YJH-8 TaxID=3228714 RepID=UPI0038CB5BE0
MQFRDLCLVIALMAIWGFNFSMIRLGVTDVDPFIVAAGRFFFAAVPACFFIRKPTVPWRYLIGYGICFGIGVWGMGLCSIHFGLSSGMASVLQQADILTSVLVGAWFYKEKITARLWLSIIVATIGLVFASIYTNGNVTLMGGVFMLISVISWPLAGVIVRQSKTKSVFAFNIWGMVFAPLPLLVLSMVTHGSQVWSYAFQHWNGNTWLSVLFQAYPTTLLGYWLWNRMIIKYPMSYLAPFTLLVSVFALMSGYWIFGETLSPIQWVSCGLFLVGVGLIISPQSSLKKTDKLTDQDVSC